MKVITCFHFLFFSFMYTIYRGWHWKSSRNMSYNLLKFLFVSCEMHVGNSSIFTALEATIKATVSQMTTGQPIWVVVGFFVSESENQITFFPLWDLSPTLQHMRLFLDRHHTPTWLKQTSLLRWQFSGKEYAEFIKTKTKTKNKKTDAC